MSLAQVKRNLEMLRDSNYILSIQFPSKIHTNSDKSISYIAAVHLNGADFIHPGGTDYGYNTKEDAASGRVRFLKKGSGYMVIGTTGPHRIVIPERDFVTASWNKFRDDFWKIVIDKIQKRITSASFDVVEILNEAAFWFQEKTKEAVKQNKLGLTPLKSRIGSPLADTSEMINLLIVRAEQDASN